MNYAFRELELPRMVAVTYPDNRASQRVLEKLGFTRQGERDYNGAWTAFYVRERGEARGR